MINLNSNIKGASKQQGFTTSELRLLLALGLITNFKPGILILTKKINLHTMPQAVGMIYNVEL